MKKEQKMRLAGDLFPPPLAGEKLCSIRAGKRDFTAGPLTFESKRGQITLVLYDPPKARARQQVLRRSGPRF
jgi:hypothetical protein